MKRALFVLLGILSLLALIYLAMRGPSPEEILASIEVPPAPVLSTDEALGAFRVAPGFRVELVAAEPLVVDPVAMDWDDRGRLYVVEMRGFMPNIDGEGEDRPNGRVVVLEDTDGDGRMDRSDVFLDGLVLPRAVAVLPEGVLVGAPPDLWLCRDTTGDRACDDKKRIGPYAADGTNPEHQENGLLAGLDGWIYNAKSRTRIRLRGDELESEETQFRGQWGIAQDDEGQLFYNHNSGFLYGDVFPAEYALRQAATASRLNKPGVNVPLSEDELVWGVRVAPGLNRAYLPGTLRADGRQNGPTAISGIAIQRGDQYGPDYRGHAFVPESAGAAVAHFAIEAEGTTLRAEHRLYADPDWEKREFLASTDERFRPVDADFGPDGAIYVIDMYRGVVQHAEFVSDYLREYVAEHGLEPPGAFGRIWRIVREDRPISRGASPLDSLDEQLTALDSPNGWVRDRAQRRILHEREPSAPEALRARTASGPLGRIHVLWTLAGLDALDHETWQSGLGDGDPAVRRTALRAGESFLSRGDPVAITAVLRLLEDPDPGVRLQVLHGLGEIPAAQRPLEPLLAAARGDDELTTQAALSSLSGLELAALEHALARPGDDAEDEREEERADARANLLAKLASALHLSAQTRPETADAVRGLLDRIAALPDPVERGALLEGIANAQALPGSRRVELDAPHPLFAPETIEAERDDAVKAALARVRPHITWPGDPRPGGARPLTPEEKARAERGAALFATSCASCHGPNGGGHSGLAPSLVGSPWVRDADAWLVRIALHGITGPLHIDGRDWNQTMPGHGHDPRFDDEGLAGVLTHLRRSWGHAEDPIDPETVAAIRAAESERALPWTVAELEALPVEHRLDRYVGVYEIPIVSLEIVVRRENGALTVGRRTGGTEPLEEIGGGAFVSRDMALQFETDEGGRVESARLDYQGNSVSLSKAE